MQLLCIPFWLVSIAKCEKWMPRAGFSRRVASEPPWLLTLARKRVILSPMETASARVHGLVTTGAGAPACARTSAEVGVWAGARIGAANSTRISTRISAAISTANSTRICTAASTAAGALTRA